MGQLVLHGITKTKEEAILASMRLQPGKPIDDPVLKAAEEKTYWSHEGPGGLLVPADRYSGRKR